MDDERRQRDQAPLIHFPEPLFSRMLRYLERYHGENHFNRWQYVEQGIQGLLADGHVQKVAEVNFPRLLAHRPGLMFFEMPNSLRPSSQSLGLTGTPSEFTNAELPLDDEYADLSEWDLEDEAFGGNVPTVLVFDDEGEVGEAALAEGMESEGFDIAGEYAPGYPESQWAGQPDWGIYIYTEQIDQIAKLFFRGQTIDPFQAWMVSFRAILYHEYFHFLSEYHCRRVAKTRPTIERYIEYSEHMNAALNDDLEREKVQEEAVANAYSFHRLYKHAKTDWLFPIANMFDAGGEPYLQYSKYIKTKKKQMFGLSVIASQHETFWPIPSYKSFNEESASIFFPKPKVDVPVYLVSNTNKIRILNGQYRIHPDLLAAYPGAQPYADELEEIMELLNNKHFKHINKLFSTADEKMTYYEGGKRLGYNIAVFSQIQDSESIWLIYFGSKENCPYEL